MTEILLAHNPYYWFDRTLSDAVMRVVGLFHRHVTTGELGSLAERNKSLSRQPRAADGYSRNWLGPQVPDMLKLKDTERSLVSLTFDGCVVKQYRGHLMRQRMENEIRVLEHLERVGCPFVPRLVSFDRAAVHITVTACGVAATHVGPAKLQQLFQELREYGVEHEDAELRNITYDARAGQFCVIDFEFARIIDQPERLFDRLDELSAALD